MSELKTIQLAREKTIKNTFAGKDLSDDVIIDYAYEIEKHFTPLSISENKLVNDNYDLIKGFQKGNYDILTDKDKRVYQGHTLDDVLSNKYNTPLSRKDIARVIDGQWLNDSVSFLMNNVILIL
jgi:hypothetical protein